MCLESFYFDGDETPIQKAFAETNFETPVAIFTKLVDVYLLRKKKS